METKIDIAYRIPGVGWRRKTVKEKDLHKVCEKLRDQGAVEFIYGR